MFSPQVANRKCDFTKRRGNRQKANEKRSKVKENDLLEMTKVGAGAEGPPPLNHGHRRTSKGGIKT